MYPTWFIFVSGFIFGIAIALFIIALIDIFNKQ